MLGTPGDAEDALHDAWLPEPMLAESVQPEAEP
jgi:hypothetical protein